MSDKNKEHVYVFILISLLRRKVFFFYATRTLKYRHVCPMYYWTRYGDSFIKEKPYFCSGRQKIRVDFFLLSTPKTSK